MSFIRPWAVWRRIQYGLGFFSFWLLIGVAVYYLNFYQAPSCLDGMRNGDETGVDCGGRCVQICASDVIPPQLVWAKSFEIVKGQYNAVAYIENKNREAATPELAYEFTFFSNGEEVASRSGTTILPPNSVYPIFEGRIFTDSQLPITETVLTLTPANLWLPATIGRDQFRSTEEVLTGADSRPKLDVQIENTEVVVAKDVEVVATIFNDNGDPVTASQTFVEQINPRSTKQIYFTWPSSIAKTVRNCVIPTDVVLGIDLSGSMNNDGGDPPQPVTDALTAAANFAGNLKTNDQVSVLTFATNAQVTSPLSRQHDTIATDITKLAIAPAEERGYTNTVEALKVAGQELSSERHNDDARRVLVLLTDGLPTTKGSDDVVAEAIAQAAVLHDNNIEVYAIGLGEQVDKDFIAKVASSPVTAYFAPTGSDLKRIYSEITSSLCEVGPTKIDVFAKTKTNFAEIKP